MTNVKPNPAIAAWLSENAPSGTIGQVLIRKEQHIFRLCHIDDQDTPHENLNSIETEVHLRTLVATDEQDRFRPLRSAPNLRKGWILNVPTEAKLWDTLNIIYPGSIGEWFALKTGKTLPVSFREFTGRQSGMYRSAKLLEPSHAEQIAQICCQPRHCLKDRHWQVTEPRETGEIGSQALVCREPCQILLELARREAKAKQEDCYTIQLPKSAALGLTQSLRHLANHPSTEIRAADLSTAANPLRAELLATQVETQFPGQTDELSE
jgi:hypothetical protein